MLRPKTYQKLIKNISKSIPYVNIKRRISPVCQAYDTMVLFDYIDLYSKYMCVQSDVNTCTQQIIIPSIAEQYQVVKTFMSISHHLHHLHDLEGVILKLIISHDVETLNKLLSSLEEYNTSIDIIKNIISYTQSIPTPSITSTFSN